MAVRVSHTNNSSGHDGTYVYRSTSPMDPQNLPAPIADAPPVALGATFEYIDDPGDGDFCYRTQDYQAGSFSQVSDEYCIFIGEDLSSAQVGDYVAGGVYAGTLSISGQSYHIIAATQDAEASGPEWKTATSSTFGTDSRNDGLANTNAIISAGISTHPAADHCVSYSGGGNEDWYLPAPDELDLVVQNLAAQSHPEFSADTGFGRWTSQEASSANANAQRLSGEKLAQVKTSTVYRTRPIRRVAL